MPVRAPFSFQLYSARNFPPMDSTLSTVAELGYTNVEPYGGLFADIGALQTGLAANGLTALTAHAGLADLENDFDSMVGKIQGLGVETVIVPFVMPADRPSDAAGWAAFGQRLGDLAEKLAAKDLKLAWHNHEFEFHQLPDGTSPIEHILGDSLAWQADIAWIVRGGADPMEWLDRYAGRVVSAHVKDIAPAGQCEDEDGWADVGQGTMDWPALWNKAVEAGADVMVAEHDNPNDFVRFATRSIAAMKQYAGS